MTSNSLEALRIVPILQLGGGILISLICLPLIWGKVPPNRLYGIRTPLAFSSEENWYRLNRYGGRILFRSGIFIALIGIAGLFLPASWLVAYSIIAAVLVLGSILGAAALILSAR